MKKFKVLINYSLDDVIEVEAEDRWEAEEKAAEIFKEFWSISEEGEVYKNAEEDDDL